MTIRIFHITSIEAAESILAKRQFFAVCRSPYNFDSGLNCFGYQGQFRLGQYYEGTGARLILDWSGPVEVYDEKTHKQVPIGKSVLFDMRPWKYLIPVGASKEYLRVVGVRFEKDAIDNYLPIPRWLHILPVSYQIRFRRKQKLEYLRAIRRYFRNSPLNLNVV